MRGAGGAAGLSGGGKQTEGNGERRDPAPGAVSGAGPPSPGVSPRRCRRAPGAAAKMTVP
ncbi:hypothetical protein STEG23_022401, partial [Scotinomys teguina]